MVQEYLFELFLQGKMPAGSPDNAAQKAVLNRLIIQKLLDEEVKSATVDSADSRKTAQESLGEIRKKFGAAQAYRAALHSLGMTEEQVLERLALDQEDLRMIDQRLRPSAWPASGAVETYYKETFVPEFAKQRRGPAPDLSAVRDQIQEILVQKRMNELLDQWLEQLKSTHRVVIHSY